MQPKLWKVILIVSLSLMMGGGFALLARLGQKSVLSDELQNVAHKMQTEKFESGSDIVAVLQNIDITPRTIPQATYLLTRLVTAEKNSNSKQHFVDPRTSDLLPTNPSSETTGRYLNLVWRAGANQNLAYIFHLADVDFGKTKEVLRYFLNLKEPVYYFDLLVAQAGHELGNLQISTVNKPLALSERTKRDLKFLFADDKLIRWAKAHASNLGQFSGQPNTVIGLFDWISYPQFREKTGFTDFPKDAQAYFDIGGGYATPDISRLIGQQFVSLDALSPQSYRHFNIQFQVLEQWNLEHMGQSQDRFQTPEERQSYVKLLDKQPWIDMDLFENSLPTRYDSYFITSFGFLSSPGVRPSDQKSRYRKAYVSVRRIVELVALGKDVSVFAYQRATAKKYRTVFLQFKKGKLTIAKLWPPDRSLVGAR